MARKLPVPIVLRHVLVPRGAEATRRLQLARLGDVVFLDRELLLEPAHVARGLRVCFVGPARGAEHGRAVDALDGVLHALRRQDAAVVVLQDALRAATERIEGAQRDEAEQYQPCRERQLSEDELRAQRHARGS